MYYIKYSLRCVQLCDNHIDLSCDYKLFTSFAIKESQIMFKLYRDIMVVIVW